MPKPHQWRFTLRPLLVFIAILWSVLLSLSQLHVGPTSRGYSSGHDCYVAECALKPSITLCINCCASRCPSWVKACSAYCTGSSPPAAVYKELSEAGLRLQGGGSDLLDVNLINALRDSSNEGYARAATLIAAESPSLFFLDSPPQP